MVSLISKMSQNMRFFLTDSLRLKVNPLCAKIIGHPINNSNWLWSFSLNFQKFRLYLWLPDRRTRFISTLSTFSLYSVSNRTEATVELVRDSSYWVPISFVLANFRITLSKLTCVDRDLVQVAKNGFNLGKLCYDWLQTLIFVSCITSPLMTQ